MLTIRHIHDGQVEVVAPDGLRAAAGGGGYLWIDVSEPEPHEEEVLDHGVLGLDPLVTEDMREDVHLPKLDLYADHLLLTVHAIELEASTVELETVELDVALGPGFLVTYHHRPVSAIEHVATTLAVMAGGLDRPVLLLHRILDATTDVFVPFLDLLGRRLDLVEEDVIAAPTEATRSEIFALRRDLITLRRISVPQAEVIRRLGRDPIGLIDAVDRQLFRDVFDHLYRMAEVSEVYRQLVESAYDMYRSVRDDQTTRRLTVLTMVSTMLLPITVVAGIYGMNFEHMPELGKRWAYPLVWAVFVLIVVASLVVFRTWGWIGRHREDEAMARRRRLVEQLEVPHLGTVLRVPAYGARFALAGGRQVLRLPRRLRRGLSGVRHRRTA
ncbi:MAG TPA: magnesium transporter CorA family protein [Nitriliruptorales bacterium]|nr:magnesium transporter CorA family protein [Nitriliruptorales bacterium]